MIKSFLILAHTSSFTEAARQSYFTQQAISKQIAKLESELNCPLFLRLHNGLKLTPEGEIYFHAFSQSITLINQAGEEVTRRRASQDEHLCFGYLEMLVINDVWIHFLQRYRAEHPELTVTIGTYTDGNIWEALMNDDIDAVIMFCSPEEANQRGLFCVPIPMQDNHIHLCVNRNYPGAATAKSYRDFKDITLFFNDQNPELAIERARRSGFNPDNIRLCSNISSALLSVNMLDGGVLVGNHTEFRDNPNLLFFETPDHGIQAQILWKKENCKNSLQRMLAQYRIYADQNGGRG